MNTFLPSVDRAREIRRAMDEALWSSVRDLLADPAGAVSAQDPPDTNFLDYASYFDLELVPPGETELSAKVKAAATEHLVRRLAQAEKVQARSGAPRVTNFSVTHYSADQVEQMRRWWDIEPANRMAMTQATDAEFACTASAIETAIGRLRDAAPELLGEVEAIVRDIVLSRPDGTNLINYSGASSFALWGAITINTETQVEWTQAFRQIVHETGHNLLFGIAREEPLVLDSPSGRSRSPIRADPRPMDGIFHAAFVSAREAYALDAMLCHHEKTGCLAESDAQIIEDLLELSVLAFRDGLETLRHEAKLTTLGQKVLADSEAYMNSAFAIEAC